MRRSLLMFELNELRPLLLGAKYSTWRLAVGASYDYTGHCGLCSKLSGECELTHGASLTNGFGQN